MGDKSDSQFGRKASERSHLNHVTRLLEHKSRNEMKDNVIALPVATSGNTALQFYVKNLPSNKVRGFGEYSIDVSNTWIDTRHGGVLCRFFLVFQMKWQILGAIPNRYDD